MDAAAPEPARGDAALLATGTFVECVFHCPACGLGGTSLARPAALTADKPCLGCGAPVVVTVLDRFARR
jgi:hypothetical protein